MSSKHKSGLERRSVGSEQNEPSPNAVNDGSGRGDSRTSTPTEGRTQAGETLENLAAGPPETDAQAFEHFDEASQFQRRANEYYEEGREWFSEIERLLEVRIREKPLQSVLMAGAMGLLLALLWTRR